VWEFEPGFIFNKPSEVVKMLEDVGEANFTALFDCCHAYMCSVVAARQMGEKETLPGGVIEFARLLKGKIGMVHLIDSDGTLHDNDTSTHAPFGLGKLDMDAIYQELIKPEIYAGDFIGIDLCFWPDAWNVTKQCYDFVRGLQRKYEQ
jgi:sugar phosphate isomerase/epimerase